MGLERLERVVCNERDWLSKLDSLYMRGVDFVLCNRFNKLFLPLAGELAICIRTGYVGDARKTLLKCLSGQNLRSPDLVWEEIKGVQQ